MFNRAFFVVPFVPLFVACGGGAKPATPPVEAKTAETETKADEKKVDEKKAEEKKPKGPFHWTDYSGPKVQTTITTKKAWAIIPVGLDGDFGIVKAALLDYVKAEGDEHVLLRSSNEQIYVPQAMVQPTAKAKGVKKGAALFVNVAAASGFGRATEVVKGEGGELDRVKFKYEWAGSISEDELPIDEVIVLEDKLAFGQPVAVPVNGAKEAATLVYTDKDSTWVITATGKPEKLATKDVKALKVSKVFKKGDKVLAPSPFELKPGKITEVLDDGARYKVKPDAADGKEDTFSFQVVSAPL